MNRDNPAQGHKSHLCHLSPCGQGTLLSPSQENGAPQKASASHWEISHLCAPTTRSQQQTLSNSCITCSCQELSEKGTKSWSTGKVARSEASLAKHPKASWSGLTPHPKNPNFYTNPGRGGKHIDPFIGGTRDGLRLRGGTVQAPSGCLRGKPLLGEAGKGSCPCQNPGSREAPALCTKPSRSQGRGVVSLLSHEEFRTVYSWDLGGGRDGVGSLQEVWQHGASRRGRGNAFLGPLLQILWEERKENGGDQGEGVVLPRCWRCRVFPSRWASRTSASACG